MAGRRGSELSSGSTLLQLSGWAAVLATVPSSASPYGAENDGTKDGERRDPQGERE